MDPPSIALSLLALSIVSMRPLTDSNVERILMVV